MKAPEFKDIDPKIRAKYFRLLKDGYYLRPEVFSNGTIYSICKDLNPVNCKAERREYGQVNFVTAQYMKKHFGFQIKSETRFFGKCEPVRNYDIRYWTYN